MYVLRVINNLFINTLLTCVSFSDIYVFITNLYFCLFLEDIFSGLQVTNEGHRLPDAIRDTYEVFEYKGTQRYQFREVIPGNGSDTGSSPQPCPESEGQKVHFFDFGPRFEGVDQSPPRVSSRVKNLSQVRDVMTGVPGMLN